MIERFLGGADWGEPPPAMAFEAPYGDILDEIAELVDALLPPGRTPTRADGSDPDHGSDFTPDPDVPAITVETAAAAARLYVLVPAIVNVLLNYKICVEHDLPLHPTVYYELAEAKRYRIEHPIGVLEDANRLFRESIALARAAYRLDPNWKAIAAEFRSRLPSEILRFIYTGGLDKYTWRASEPEKIAALAASIRTSYAPDLLVAAAHGSIAPALLLAEYLGIPLYFLRFSMFKRKDEAPIVSLADEAWLSTWRRGKGLIFDEDVAKGTTLDLFAQRLRGLFAESRTACVMRHAGARMKPDFAAHIWWDESC